MSCDSDDTLSSLLEKMAAEELIREKTDEKGNKWVKVYFGGGRHFENWLEQCRELGEVEVEEVKSTGYKCFELSGEKMYRIWMKAPLKNEKEFFEPE